MNDETAPADGEASDAEPTEPSDTEASDAETLGYAGALDELDTILRELEGSDVDVDRLADRVARAADLIAACRTRISSARVRIDEVIAELDGVSDLGDAGRPQAP